MVDNKNDNEEYQFIDPDVLPSSETFEEDEDEEKLEKPAKTAPSAIFSTALSVSAFTQCA